MGKVSTDVIMQEVWSHLVSDFRTLLKTQSYAAQYKTALDVGISNFRLASFPGRMAVSPLLYKCDYQLETLFKRYRFQNDMYSQRELETTSWEKFQQTQLRLDTPIVETPFLNVVLRNARKIAKEILGEYDLEEHMSRCAFGKRACVGTGYGDSNLHIKLSRPLTGSIEHIRWFKEYLKTDTLLLDTIKEAQGKTKPSFRICRELKMTLVPKSYKALRSVMPDTLCGSFYTRGLGEVLALRLKSAGLNIRTLQERHGILAQRSSVRGHLVTADLSAASDSITTWLLRRVLPGPWYRVVTHGRIPFIRYKRSSLRMNTVLTMGLGHTFPLQTLIFYSLLESIRRLKSIRTKCSVYGDDLIYPKGIHNLVRYVFPRINLNLNGDKTYAETPFRESCGSDYYRGVDVRPFNPEGEHRLLGRLYLGQFLYKLYNGISRRWTAGEIPATLNYLYNAIITHCGECFVVPPHFPDTSGVKFGPHVPVRYTDLTFAPDVQSCTFNYVKTNSGRRRVRTQRCYYWEWLRQRSTGDTLSPYSDLGDVPALFWAKKVRFHKGKKRVTLIPMTSDKRSSHVNKSCAEHDLFYASPVLRL